MQTNKKRQHYVWKKYLKPWTSNGKIWCKHELNIFNPALENIGQEKYFYAAKPLNEVEVDILKNYIMLTPVENHSLLMQALNEYIKISNSPSDHLKKNGMEDYHESIEHSVDNILDCLYEKNLEFFKDNINRASFCYFLAQQYFRTKAMIERAKEALKNLSIAPPKEIEGKFDSENISKAFLFLFSDSIANFIYDKMNIFFIETDFEFITSDQPIINIHSNSNFNPVTDVEFYYPITPHLALFITSKYFCNKKIDKDETDTYNKIMYDKSYRQIYSFTKEALLLF